MIRKLATTLFSVSAALIGHHVGAADDFPPEANPVSVSLSEDTSTSVVFSASSVHFSGTFEFDVSTLPAHGQISPVSGDHVVYTPSPHYVGNDSFTYIASDPFGTSAPATVTINVTPAAVVASTVSVPATSTWALLILSTGLLSLVAGKNKRHR